MRVGQVFSLLHCMIAGHVALPRKPFRCYRLYAFPYRIALYDLHYALGLMSRLVLCQNCSCQLYDFKQPTFTYITYTPITYYNLHKQSALNLVLGPLRFRLPSRVDVGTSTAINVAIKHHHTLKSLAVLPKPMLPLRLLLAITRLIKPKDKIFSDKPTTNLALRHISCIRW